MDLQEAQAIVGRAAENPVAAAKIPAHDVAVATATVLAHSGLLGLRLSRVGGGVVTAEVADG